MTTQGLEELGYALWSIVKNDSLASSRIGHPSGNTRTEMMKLIEQELTKARLEAYKHGLLTGAMPEALGKPIAEDYIATLTTELNQEKL